MNHLTNTTADALDGDMHSDVLKLSDEDVYIVAEDGGVKVIPEEQMDDVHEHIDY